MTLRIDTHVHAGVLGDDNPEEGFMSPWMRREIPFRVFLFYNRIKPQEVSDRILRERLLRTILESKLDQVVCLAMDPVYDDTGSRQPDLSNMWVDNKYVLRLAQEFQQLLPPHEKGKRRILLGASVHPYDPKFEDRVAECVDQGAVLLKWLPSAQWINLADPRVGKALKFLATAREGRPLPVLIHVGAEYSIITTDPKTTSYDFLSWGFWDRVWNRVRPPAKRWATPNLEGIAQNFKLGFEAGACVILAHCGLPYFAPSFLRRFAEHSDLDAVRKYLELYPGTDGIRGKCFADVSACVTPFRKSYFKGIARLPKNSLLAGSDFPVPVFELSADLGENLKDLEAVLRGEFDRVIIPQDNLLTVNWRELEHAFPGHPMFTNALQLL